MNETSIEVFVQKGFSELELASILTVLHSANEIASEHRFDFQIVSDSPGLLAGRDGLLTRAEPSIGVEYLADILIVLGGNSCSTDAWGKRIRAMRLFGKPVYLLSNAATEYIKSYSPAGPVTTQWTDFAEIGEMGNSAKLSTNLAETNSGVTTCAGQGYTNELMIWILREFLFPQECAEIASVLGIERARNPQTDQPIGASANSQVFEPTLTKALELMETAIDERMSIPEIAESASTSVRQLERLFSDRFGISPARYYRRLRLKRAKKLVLSTRLDIIDIALACGFSSASGLSSAYRKEFGNTPLQTRRE